MLRCLGVFERISSSAARSRGERMTAMADATKIQARISAGDLRDYTHHDAPSGSIRNCFGCTPPVCASHVLLSERAGIATGYRYGVKAGTLSGAEPPVPRGMGERK